MAYLGVELAARTIRAVRVEGWPRQRTRTLEVECDGENPGDVVAPLRQLGPVRRVAIALDLSRLLTKRVKLPALPAADRRQILRLEPERFFAVRAQELVPAVRADDDLVFATSEADLAGWVTALELLAPIELVEPTPTALARGLARARLSDAVMVLDEGGDDGLGMVRIRDGAVTSARRLFGDLQALPAALAADGPPTTIYLSPWRDERARALGNLVPAATVHPFPAAREVAGPFLAAFGAALGIDTRPDFATTLVSPEHASRVTSRRWRALGFAVGSLVLTLGFAVASVNAWRTRATRAVAADVETLRHQAAPAVALQNELEALGREARAIHDIERERPDPLGVLLVLSRRLPVGAYLRGLRWSGAEWQIDGYAPNAARLVSELGAAAPLKDVRFLSATTRTQVANRTYESFALAFRYAPAP